MLAHKITSLFIVSGMNFTDEMNAFISFQQENTISNCNKCSGAAILLDAMESSEEPKSGGICIGI